MVQIEAKVLCRSRKTKDVTTLLLDYYSKIENAQAIYNSVLKSKPSDIGLIAVASNNMLCLNKDQNIFDSKKRIKAATVEGLEHKLTSKHQSAIARNNTLL